VAQRKGSTQTKYTKEEGSLGTDKAGQGRETRKVRKRSYLKREGEVNDQIKQETQK